MEEYGKTFKKIVNNTYNFSLVNYDEKLKKYSDVIKEQKDKGYRQVLFNSELMLKLIAAIEKYPNEILKNVNMCSDTDQRTQANINDLVLKTRTETKYIKKLVSELEWYSDNESIDIISIEFFNIQDNNSVTVKTNGILHGVRIGTLFDKLIIKNLREYYEGI